MVVHTKDDQEVGMAHEIKSPKNQPPDDNGVVLVRQNQVFKKNATEF